MRKCLKLLMFALLRSSACSIRQATSTTSIQLRLATRTDLPAIERVNIACLPENYNSQFYSSHLRQWPDLALVAEEVDHTHPNSISEERQSQSRKNFPGFAGGQKEPKIVAYVLGKVETRPSIDYNNPTSQCTKFIDSKRLNHLRAAGIKYSEFEIL